MEGGKRVSWSELYLDLVFVLAVGQLTHLIVHEPRTHSVWVTLGLFFVLWWTWIAFVVLYNRADADDLTQRVLLLASSIPTGVAAVAVQPASTGDVTAFALAMAAVRVLLIAAHLQAHGRAAVRDRLSRGCTAAALLFAVSIAIPEPWRYPLWFIAIAVESQGTLREDRDAAERAKRDHDFSALKPQNPEEALDADHFAERFGLFVIILLGEVVIDAGQASADVSDLGGWVALICAMVLAGALWWLYFDAAATLNLRALQLSGGSPTLARAVYAVGHMLPAFSLLLTAAGVGLLLEDEVPRIAFTLTAVGCGIYLLGTRVLLRTPRGLGRAVRFALLIATFWLGQLHHVLGAHAFLAVLAVWTTGLAVLASSGPEEARPQQG